MKVVRTESLLFSIKNMRASGMGKRTVCDALTEIVINNTIEAEPTKHGVIELTYEEYGELCSYALADEPKHGRCNTCRYMTKDELCTRYDDENGTHSTMPEGYCWLWERRMDEVQE